MKMNLTLKAILLGACGLALWGDPPRGGVLAEQLVSGEGGKAAVVRVDILY